MTAKDKKNHKISVFFRLIALLGPLFILSQLSIRIGVIVAVGIIFSLIYFAFFRQYLWFLLVLALPGLCLGEIIAIPITENWSYEAGLAEIFLLLSSGLFFLDAYLSRKISSFKIDFISFVLYLYFLASLASIFFIVDFRLFVFGLKTSFYGFLAYFLVRQLLCSRKKIKWFLYGLSVTATILSLQIFYKFYSLGFSSKFFLERNTILLPIAPLATTAAILALLAPIVLTFFFQLSPSKISRLAVAISAVFTFTAVFVSLGKAAIASLLSGFLYIFIKVRNIRVPFILIGLWFVFGAYLLLNPFFSGLMQRIQTTFVDANTEFRILEYRTSWDLIMKHPLRGSGSGQQLYYFKEMLDYETSNLVNNFFVQALIDLGVVGLGLVSALFIGLTRKTKNAIQKSLDKGGEYLVLLYGLSAAMIVAFLNGLVEVTFYALPYAIIFWLIAGVFINIQQIVKESDLVNNN